MDGTLYCFPSSAQITSMALAMCGGAPPGLSIVKGNPEELPRLELRNGGPVILGDRAIARFVSRVGGSTVKESPAASAAVDQWLDLTATFGAAELLDLLEAALIDSTFLAPGSYAPGLADAAALASLKTLGKLDATKFAGSHPAVARWLRATSAAAAVQVANKVLFAAPPSSSSSKTKAKDQGKGKDVKGASKDGDSSDVGGCPPLEGAEMGKVVTRFPPEPSGYLHIGHAKAVLLNEYYARRYKGKLLVRFDDTNPSKEKEEFEENIMQDLATLGVKPDAVSHSSDHFEKAQELARKLINDGNAYMDGTPQEKMQAERKIRVKSARFFIPVLELLPNKSAEDERIRAEAGKVMALWSEGEAEVAKLSEDEKRKITPVLDAFAATEEKGLELLTKDAKYLKAYKESHLEAFERMLKGDDTYKQYCLRGKLDMSSDNGTMRDPVLYRANDTPHHRTGTKYKAYPTYDMVCPIVDSVEGVTHALRTTEYDERNHQYAALQKLMQLRPVRIWSFSKLNLVYTVMSKRKLQWFVDNQRVPGWSDPRFPTVQGVIRRGVSIFALRKFIYAQGASRSVTLQEWDKFWAINKDEFEPKAPRYMGIATEGATPLRITGGDALELDSEGVMGAAISVKLVPPMKEASPVRPMRVAGTVFLEAEDAATCSVGDKLILVNWGVVEVKAVDKDSNGNVIGLSGERQPEASVKKIPRKFTWVAQTPDVLAGTIKEYDHLITKPKLEENEDFKDFLRDPSTGSMQVLLEPCLRSLKQGDVIQLMRRGFFRVDQAHDEAKQQGLELILVPDGKEKSMSTLKTALPHC